MPIQITPERPDSPDAQALIAELQASLAPLYPSENQFGYSVEKLVRQRVAFFVIRADDAPAACGGVQLFGTEYGEVKRMFVRPQFRGMGLGRLMLAQLEAHARTHGVPLLRLETGTFQTEALGLYEQYGFYPVGPFGDYRETPFNLYFEKRTAPGLDAIRNYPRAAAQDVQVVSKRVVEDLERTLLVMQTPFGYKRAAEIYAPQDARDCAAILYVHWYEPHAPDSNRYQFVEEAKAMARAGAVCMMVETLWSDIDFFIKRAQADDIENSIRETIHLRRALDVLLQQPGVDPKRAAFVGHDFGGMYGVLMGSSDRRPSRYVIMAATPRFPDWYLYSPALDGAARETFILQMSAYDPIAHIANLAPAPVLFQFATDDFHVPKERAEEFFAAAREPKAVKWYDAGHGLNAQATADRQAWLNQQIGLQS